MILAARVQAAPLAVQILVALLLGASGALAHAPFDIGPAILFPLTGIYAVVRFSASSLRAAILALVLGVGYFGVTMTWITEPFQVDATSTGWMAPFALVLLALGLGVFWAAAAGFAHWAGGRIWMLVAALAGAELLRAYVFTGFPWATPPQALVETWAGQGLAWFGPHGLVVLMCAVVFGTLSLRGRWVWGAVPLVVGVGVLLRPYSAAPSAETEHMVRLVQPNAPQHQKWDPEHIPTFVNRQIDYTAAGPVPDLIVWSETALPYLVEQAQPVFDVVAAAARGAPVALGIQRRDGDTYYNSLVVLDEAGQAAQTYDKHHLVPFGEYMPLPRLFRNLGIQALSQRVDQGYGRGAGPVLLDMGPLGKALPLICYEAVFAHDVGRAAERPDFLLQVTNDAWFGMRSGPQQHLAHARMRAIEQGLPLIRAANTGVSAVIDSKGRITASLGLNKAGYVDAHLPVAGQPTVYSLTGDAPWVLLILVGLVGAVVHKAKQRDGNT